MQQLGMERWEIDIYISNACNILQKLSGDIQLFCINLGTSQTWFPHVNWTTINIEVGTFLVKDEYWSAVSLNKGPGEGGERDG
jgi:hypothetical protein